MKIDCYRCDFCGAVKGETNKWFLGFIGQSGIFNLFHWPDKGDEDSARGFKHICGRECAQKFLEQYMGLD